MRNFQLPPSLRSLRHPNYRLFMAGQFISLIGTWMQSLGESWLVYRLTGSAVLLGGMQFCSQIPVFLLGPIGGSLSDRMDRRRVLIFTQSVMMALAFVLAALTLTGRVRPWHLFVLASLLGVARAVDIPARQSFVVDLVGRDDLINAIALNSSLFNGARIVGPAIAGIVVAAVGEGWCFFINGASYIAVVAGLAMIKMEAPAEVRTKSGLTHVAEGFKYVLEARPILILLALLGVVSLVAMPYVTLMPIFAETILHGGARGLGILMASSGAGALIGAFVLAHRQDIKGLGRWIALGCGGFGIAMIAFSLSKHLWLSSVLLVPAGFCMMIQMASTNTLVQSMTPDNLRGRVMALYSMMFMGMAPIGALAAGALAGQIGAPVTVASGGCISIVAALVFARMLPGLREHARPLLNALQTAPDAAD